MIVMTLHCKLRVVRDLYVELKIFFIILYLKVLSQPNSC